MSSSQSPNKSVLTSIVDFTDPYSNCVLEALSKMKLSELKTVITGARYGEFPSIGQPLYERITQPIEMYLKRHFNPSKVEDVIHQLNTLAAPPFTSHLINLILLIEPSIEEILQARHDSFISELTVMEMTRRPPTINWDAIFLGKHDSFLINTPQSNVYAHEEIARTLSILRDDMENVTLLPYGSKKGVSSITQSDARHTDTSRDRLEHLSVKIHYSAKDLVERYMQGYEEIPDGPCQLKQKWYPTGLKPRTYYAQGGSALKSSMYLRAFFNELADRFQYTNRFQRVDVTRFHVKDPSSSKMFVYDYSNFTSNCSEQYYFLSHLGEFMRGCAVYLLQPELDVIVQDLGELILEYRDVCNDRPEYYWEEGFLGFNSMMMVHNQAGFLGVYGNLMTCTVPHGFVARELVESPQEVGTAGDDGMIEPKYPINDSIKYLQCIGEFAASKCYTSPHVVYLKRRVLLDRRYGLSLQPWIQFPTYSTLSVKYNRLSRRFTHMTDMPQDQFRFALYSSIVNSVRQYSEMDQYYQFGNEAAGRFAMIINSLIRFHGLNIGKTLKFTISRERMCSRKPLYLLEGDMPTKTYHFYPFYHLDRTTLRRIRGYYPFRPQYLTPEDTIVCNSDRYVRMLEMTGYLEELDEDTELDMVSVFDYDLHRFVEQGPEVRRYIVKKGLTEDKLWNVINRPLEKLNKRKMAEDDFVRFTKRERVGRRLAGQFGGGYFDLDMPESDWGALELGYDDPVAEEEYAVEDTSTLGESMESDFRKNVSVMLW